VIKAAMTPETWPTVRVNMVAQGRNYTFWLGRGVKRMNAVLLGLLKRVCRGLKPVIKPHQRHEEMLR
jgi:hypothetical protein